MKLLSSTNHVIFTKNIRNMSKCIFCGIIDKTVWGDILYEDETVVVFKDINPVAKYHYLAVPRKHIKSINELTKEDVTLVKLLMEKGKLTLQESGGDINNVKLGFHVPPFNTVNHLHLHVISPTSDLSFARRYMFLDDSFWFNTADKVLKSLL